MLVDLEQLRQTPVSDPFDRIERKIRSPDMAAASGEKLGVEPAGKTSMVTVRDSNGSPARAT